MSRHHALRSALCSLLALAMIVAAQPLAAVGSVKSLEQQVQATMIPQSLSPQADRTDGEDRFGTNVKLSQAGWASSEHVVVASGRDWPDAMVGGSLAAALDAPVLLCEPDTVPDEVLAEIERLGATEAIVLGGRSAVSDRVLGQIAESGVPSVAIERIGGADRYETAALVARRVEDLTGQIEWMAMSTGENFPDALALSPWAGHMGAPLLLTRRDAVPPATRRALDDIVPTAVLLLGGENAVSSTVADAVGPHYRVGGADRYETARLMAEFASDHGMYFDNIYVARGTDWPDALSAGAVAAHLHGLIMLTPEHALDNDTLDFFKAHCSGIKQLHFVGGIEAVTVPVVEEILAASETQMASDSVVLIAGDLLDAMSAVTTDSVTFTDSAIVRERVTQDMILVLNRMPWLEPDEPLAQGFIRRITGVQTGGGVVVARTEDAAITDFVKKGSVDIHIDPISAQDIADQFDLIEQVEAAKAAGRPVEAAGVVSPQAGFGYHFEDIRNLWHNQAETASLDSTLTIDVAVVADMGIAIDWWTVEAMAVRLLVTEQLLFELGFRWEDELAAQEFALAQIPIGYWGFALGPIDLGLGIQIKPVVGWEQVTGEFDAQFRLEQCFVGAMGMLYRKGVGTTVQRQTKTSFGTTFDAHGKATARPYAGVKVEVVICGSDANTVYLMPDAYLWAQAEGEFHAWDNFEHTSGQIDASIEFGVEWRVGYALDLFGLYSDSDYYAGNIYSQTWSFGAGYIR